MSIVDYIAQNHEAFKAQCMLLQIMRVINQYEKYTANSFAVFTQLGDRKNA